MNIVSKNIISIYNIILQELFVRKDNTQEIQPPPYTVEMDIKAKMKITYNCLLKAQRLRQGISALVFAYYLGQLIEGREISKGSCKQIISEYFYNVSVRVYYIFKLNPAQILVTKATTLIMVRKLRQRECQKLTLKL